MNDETQQVDDPWHLVEQERYMEAIDEYTQLLRKNQKNVYLNNRGIAYMNLGDYTAALRDFTLSISLRDTHLRSSSEYLFQSVCFWWLGEYFRATDVLIEATTAPYTDAAGGVISASLLLYAAERLNDPDLRDKSINMLQGKIERKLTGWPKPIAFFLLGKIESQELEQGAGKSAHESVRRREKCQVDFYLALRGLRENDRNQFVRYMTRCAENNSGILRQERYFALWEVRHSFSPLIS